MEVHGAIRLDNGKLIINVNTNLNFSNNYALGGGGAVYSVNTTLHVNTDAIYFYNNSGLWGGHNITRLPSKINSES